MKKHIALLLFLALFGATGVVSARKIIPSGNSFRVAMLHGNRNSITVRSIGFGTNEAACMEDAHLRAVKTILFVGLSSTDVAQKQLALVDSDLESDPYFVTFFNDKQYKRFISSSAASSSMDKVKGQKYKEQAFDLTINLESLQRQLRSDKIIKRMGLH